MPKRNIYLSDDDIELWDSLPKGQRGRMLRDFLLDRKIKDVEAFTGMSPILAVENMSEIEREREKSRSEILSIEEKQLYLRTKRNKILNNIETKKSLLYIKERELEDVDTENSALEEQYHALIHNYEKNFVGYSDIDNLVLSKDVWENIYVEAKKKKGEIFTYPPKPKNGWIFKIKNVKNGKIEIERLDHSSGPSSSIITIRTIEKIVNKFNQEAEWYGQADAKIKSGSSFIGDHSIESAIVLLYRRMEYQGESIVFSESL